MNWVAWVVVLILAGYLLDREIYFYEGVHLGPRVQAWLYDRWARKYDAGKRESQQQDGEALAHPLVDALRDIREPFILDFAAGTGRLSFALLDQPDFTGHILALDLSQGMLEQAAMKMKGRGDPAPTGEASRPRIDFLRHPSLPLPFPDAVFDAVCALEVLELFPSMDEPLQELTRVLRPGGVLLTSRGTEESGRRAKVKSRIDFTALLEQNGLVEVEITPWWKLFDRVFALKSGSSPASGAQSLTAVLQCRTCRHIEWKTEPAMWTCRNCDDTLTVTKSGIVLN
jgi:ubiquinone/menaquinone biosynthesis C-methylase UbiE